MQWQILQNIWIDSAVKSVSGASCSQSTESKPKFCNEQLQQNPVFIEGCKIVHIYPGYLGYSRLHLGKQRGFTVTFDMRHACRQESSSQHRAIVMTSSATTFTCCRLKMMFVRESAATWPNLCCSQCSWGCSEEKTFQLHSVQIPSQKASSGRMTKHNAWVGNTPFLAYIVITTAKSGKR